MMTEQDGAVNDDDDSSIQGSLGPSPKGGRGGGGGARPWWQLITLSPGVSVVNFASYLFATSLNIALFVFINASQAFVLTQILNVPTSELGDKSGTLTFADELLSFLMVWVWGLVSDYIGRRAVYVAAYGLMGAALSVYTLAPSVGVLLLIRLLFATGGAAASSMLTAVLADYATDADRGKTAGLVGLFSGSGALVSLFVFLPLPTRFGDDATRGLRVTYWIVAVVAAVSAVVLLFALRSSSPSSRREVVEEEEERRRGRGEDGLPGSANRLLLPSDGGGGGGGAGEDDGGFLSSSDGGGGGGGGGDEHTTRDLPSGEDQRRRRPPLKELIMDGIIAAREPRVLLGYVAAFLARGDTVLITLFLPLWTYKSYIDSGRCTAPTPEDPDVRDICHDAYIRASALSGVCQTFALIGAPVFGYMGDRLRGPLALAIACVLGVVGYGALSFSHPLETPVWVWVCVVGLAEIGVVIGNLQLVTASTSVPRSMRGSVAGVSSACGALGILIMSKLGGFLFDRYEGAPFAMLGIAHVFAAILAIACWIRERMTA